MPLARDFKETVRARARRDPAFREGLLQESVECLLNGELEAAKIMLRDYINAVIGFDELGAITGKPPKSLMRMFGPNGNPRAQNLFATLEQIQRREGVRLHVQAVRLTGTAPAARPLAPPTRQAPSHLHCEGMTPV